MTTATRPRQPSGWIYPSTTATHDGDIDLIAVEYAVNGGRRGTLTRDEQVTAARILDAHDFNITEIGRRIGIDHRTVRQWKTNDWDPNGTLPAPAVKREPRPCGTRAAYSRHRVRGEEPCEPCRAANTAADRRLRNGAVAP